MTPLMAQVWPMIEAGLNDSSPSVRKAACTAVSCLCEWLEDECASKHTTLVPVCRPGSLPRTMLIFRPFRLL